jgi:hypothetical protein
MARTNIERGEVAFDRVVVGTVTYSVEEFLRLPLTVRVRHILSGEASFFRGGAPVDAMRALNGLRTQPKQGG